MIKYLKTQTTPFIESKIDYPGFRSYVKQFSQPEPQGVETEESVEESVEEPIEEPIKESVEVQPVEAPKEAEDFRVDTSVSVKSPRYTDRNQFQKDLYAAYIKALQTRGLSTDFAKYLVAQDALESGWGKHYAGNWNFGNITVGSSNASYNVGNDHDSFGNPIKQKFRNYNSIYEYALNKIDLLNSKRYKAFAGGTKEFFNRIGAGGYVGKDNPQHIKDYIRILNKMLSSVNVGEQGMKLAIPNLSYLERLSRPNNEMAEEPKRVVIKGYKPKYRF